ncbi:MAG: hypothetical protein FD166_3230 [Bacteroidetes bacterium]|nr:MAG: hypothetical protein FD166_3230 [Bacteroidota bacterium]
MRFFANAQNDFDLHGILEEGGLVVALPPPSPPSRMCGKVK